jgi:ABC-2 type transport system permease protein
MLGFTVINDPHGTIAVVFSMIPLTSHRNANEIPFGVPLWQIAISVTLLFRLLLCRLVCCNVPIGILMYGKKPTWSEMYRWLKY